MDRLHLAHAIAATIKQTPNGAPSGPLYAAIMDKVDLQEYEEIIAALTRAGLVEQRSHVLYPTAKLAAAMLT